MEKAKKLRIITPEQFSLETQNHIRMSLRNVLFQYQISYRIETDPKLKKKRLGAWEQIMKDLAQIESVLDIASREKIESVTVKTKEGKIYDCSNAEPLELTDNELGNLLIEFSKSIE